MAASSPLTIGSGRKRLAWRVETNPIKAKPAKAIMKRREDAGRGTGETVAVKLLVALVSNENE